MTIMQTMAPPRADFRPDPISGPGCHLELAVLEGGSASIPGPQRIQLVSPGEEKVKLSHWGGYEHFERHPGRPQHGPAVFRWTMRTKIAE